MLFIVPFTNYGWIIGVFWTLAVEFQFYIFIGLLFPWLFERRNVSWFVCSYLVLGAAQYLPGLSSISFFQYSNLFALGGITLLWQQKRITKLGYAGGLLLFSALAYWQLGGYVAGAGLATALSISIVNMKIPVLDFIGKISYSFYLLHVLIGTSCEFFLIKFIAPNTDSHKLIIAGTSLLAALVGAYLFYLVVELPFMRWSSKKA